MIKLCVPWCGRLNLNSQIDVIFVSGPAIHRHAYILQSDPYVRFFHSNGEQLGIVVFVPAIHGAVSFQGYYVLQFLSTPYHVENLS